MSFASSLGSRPNYTNPGGNLNISVKPISVSNANMQAGYSNTPQNNVVNGIQMNNFQPSNQQYPVNFHMNNQGNVPLQQPQNIYQIGNNMNPAQSNTQVNNQTNNSVGYVNPFSIKNKTPVNIFTNPNSPTPVNPTNNFSNNATNQFNNGNINYQQGIAYNNNVQNQQQGGIVINPQQGGIITNSQQSGIITNPQQGGIISNLQQSGIITNQQGGINTSQGIQYNNWNMQNPQQGIQFSNGIAHNLQQEIQLPNGIILNPQQGMQYMNGILQNPQQGTQFNNFQNSQQGIIYSNAQNPQQFIPFNGNAQNNQQNNQFQYNNGNNQNFQQNNSASFNSFTPVVNNMQTNNHTYQPSNVNAYAAFFNNQSKPTPIAEAKTSHLDPPAKNTNLTKPGVKPKNKHCKYIIKCKN